MYLGNQGERVILYYPTIKIQDGAWLRNGILYWDKVASIVPGFDFTECNSPEVEYLQREGLYEPVYTYELFRNEELCNGLCLEVKKKLERNAGGIDKRYGTPKDRRNITVDKIHIAKMPEQILSFLLNEGIANSEESGSPWINMSEYNSGVYMATLAKYIARLYANVEIGTDIMPSFVLPYNRVNRLSRTERQIYVELAIQDILPMPNMDTSIEEIIDFKMNHRNSLHGFKNRIDHFQIELMRCSEVDDLRYCSRVFKEDIIDEMRQVEELLSRKRIATIKKFFKVMIPIGIETGLSRLEAEGGISPAIARLVGEAMSISVKAFVDKDKTRAKRENAFLFEGYRYGMIRAK